MKESEDFGVKCFIGKGKGAIGNLDEIVFRTGGSDTSRFMENFGIFF